MMMGIPEMRRAY